ncbi:hypothetical protein EON64_10705, partial [archaeon]
MINSLMEREAIRNAEIEKLQKISKMKDDELLSLDMQDPATSVLCIKCKKSLDDMTNIRAALIGDREQHNGQKQVCENYRILLPNLRGKKPARSVHWLRLCMRSILLSKMKEDLTLLAIKSDISRFPGYVYAWFNRSIEGQVGAALTKTLVLSDEDRWALYYGCKALCREDSECQIFWQLLDEAFGQDGLQYLLYCLSVAMSLGGMAFWRQFGSALQLNACADIKSDELQKLHGSHTHQQHGAQTGVRPVVWLELQLAKQATQRILTKALAPQLAAALEAIDALKTAVADSELAEGDKPTNPSTSGASSLHINLFVWLRLMMQQLQGDQIHRAAAVRLMFETASVGAMTPAAGSGGGS